MANYGICLEPPKSQFSYLSMHNIIAAAKITEADAIHPGYGFLSENPNFADLCQKNGFVFIGPRPDVIKKMGDKIIAKQTMKRNGVPVIPGSEGEILTAEDALCIAEKLEYPVIVKAAAGGGGRGMRIANNPSELREAFYFSQAESCTAFGVESVYIEKFFPHSRHIEFQILADSFGNIIHLGERDCSTQRRYQKLIEESPSPSICSSLRKSMGEIAVKAAEAVKYDNAGTVEFLVDEDHNYYFMEMNTRIQVEHPVTEMVTGIDIVEQQLNIAAGCHLSIAQDDVEISGHAIECRINAEDPSNNFMPSPGRINRIEFPSGDGVRVDTHVFDGYILPMYYDSLIAKLVVHGKTRTEAIRNMKSALDNFSVKGIETTIPFHKEMIRNEVFWKGGIYTKFVEKLLDARNKVPHKEKDDSFNEIIQKADELYRIRELLYV